MDLNLNGKRAVVCGATQGIGRAAAVELARLGAHVVLFARDVDKLRTLVKELPRAGTQQHEYLVGDFNMPDNIKLTADIYAQGNPVHILVNNTGGPPAGPAFSARAFEFVNAFQAHLICNHYLVQAFVRAHNQCYFHFGEVAHSRPWGVQHGAGRCSQLGQDHSGRTGPFWHYGK